jgi:hypothetical protein
MSKGQRLRAERAAAKAGTEREVEQQARFKSADFSRKLDRAKTHIDTLEESVQRWLESDAYTLTEEFEPETGDHVLKAKVTEPPSDQWPLLIGDAVHNLRSALDHIAYKLALDGYQTQNAGAAIPSGHQRRIQFPIVATSNDPTKTVDEFYKQVVKGQLRYVPAPVAARIHDLQPYKRSPADPTNDLLWIINDLDVIDKHRKLATVAVANPLQGMQIGGGGIYIKKLHLNGGPVEREREIMRWAIEATGPTPVEMQRQFARFVSLSDGPGRVKTTDLIAVLRICHAEITTNVIPTLSDYL